MALTAPPLPSPRPNTSGKYLHTRRPHAGSLSFTQDLPFLLRQFLQNFYEAFPEYESRDFALFTESYGGHYGPEFSEYFLEQNAAIDAGTVTGEKINLIALGINNGWIDPLLQYQAYPIFAYNNTYNQLVNERQYEKYM